MKVVQEVNIWAFLLTIENIRFSGILLHNLSLRQVMQEVDEYQMKFHLGNKLVHFLIREWCLATRLKCVELEDGRKIGNFWWKWWLSPWRISQKVWSFSILIKSMTMIYLELPCYSLRNQSIILYFMSSWIWECFSNFS